jgi:endonuclease-3
MTKEEKVEEIVKRLIKVYPKPRTALEWSTPLELLVATMLSAQCTDKLVNLVTPELFKKFKTAKDYAQASEEEIDKFISKVTFHRNKAKNIKRAGQMMVEKFGGEVPSNMEDLDSLPGVARKTANVVLGDAFEKSDGIVVDTHVMRLSTKLGLTDKKDPEKIEKDLMEIVPKKYWIIFPHLLILSGREFYPARLKDLNSGPLQGLFVEL